MGDIDTPIRQFDSYDAITPEEQRKIKASIDDVTDIGMFTKGDSRNTPNSIAFINTICRIKGVNKDGPLNNDGQVRKRLLQWRARRRIASGNPI